MFNWKLGLLAGFLAGLLPVSALAQNNQRDMEKERAYWQELQTMAPAAVEDFKAATVALDKEDNATAIELYRRVYKKAPNFDVVMRRLGGALVRTGHKDEGISLLDAAVKKRESAENLVSLAQAYAFAPDGTVAGHDDLERALPYARRAADLYHGNDPSYLIVFAISSLRTNRVEYLRTATRRLLVEHNDLMLTHYFAAVLAQYDNDPKTCAAELKKAEALGLPASEAAALLGADESTGGTIWRYLSVALYAVGAWAAGLVLLLVLGKAFSVATLRWLERSDPNEATAPGQLKLRRYYRWLINIAGVYYYLSMPFILFLVLAVAVGITYGFIMLGQIPIKLVLILGFGALITVFSVIRSLFIKVESEDPGRTLRESEAPGVWALAREVAETVGTRPVDEIRVTPATELAVYERGSFRQRTQDRAHRVLLLGVANLNDFQQPAFRAVLAHEYGHFRHRDTAGGEVALRVNNDMIKFAVALASHGQAVWYNLAFHFLRLYHFIFRRISHGATRLQEVMADRIAAIKYSPAAFEEGLRHVVRRQVEFEDVAYWELTDAARGKRALQNLYELPVSNETAVDEKISEAISRQTSEDDTHPAPEERFRLVRRVEFKGVQGPPGLVWDLFADRAALTAEMSAQIERMLRARA